jgi:hypothetical protein
MIIKKISYEKASATLKQKYESMVCILSFDSFSQISTKFPIEWCALSQNVI